MRISSISASFTVRGWRQAAQVLEGHHMVQGHSSSAAIALSQDVGIRTWAFCTIDKSHFHFKSLPWTNVLISG